MRYKKSFKKRRKVSLLRKKWFWKILFIFLLLAGSAYLLFLSSAFEIKEIKILGNKTISYEELESAILDKIRVHDNIFFADTQKSYLISKFPKIAEASIKRKFPNSILIQIEERKPVAVLKREAKFYHLDKEGVVFEETDRSDLLRIVIENKFKLGDQVVKREDMQNILKIKQKYDTLKIRPAKIELILPERINVATYEGWSVYFNSKNDLGWQLDKLKIILEEKYSAKERLNIEYIDLRFDKIYISLKNPTKEQGIEEF